ncbi:MAG TPA: lytic murein transglycosylase, partial [Solirubrobacteraceae bacterium]|nr:lytic murein transglycosylase [Solirubrobacteraceae bacterium]
ALPGEGSAPPGAEGSTSTPTSPAPPPASTTPRPTQAPSARSGEGPATVRSLRAQPKASPHTQRPHTHGTPRPAAHGGAGSGALAQPVGSAVAPAPPPNPGALFGPAPVLAGESQVLDFFLNTYRTPPFLLPIYLAAGERYGVPWQVLAAINEVESNYGFDLSLSSAGAEGWMQFLPAEWLAYGVDANGAGSRDPYNPADAIFAAARYLAAAGAGNDLRGAIYAYNHSSSYVESVILRTRLIAATPQALIGGLSAIVSGRYPVEGEGPHAATPVWSEPAAHPAAHPASAPHSLKARAQAQAPAPEAAGEGSARTQAATVAGARITASPGAPVVAVQGAEVVATGLNARLGRFIELRDAYGDLYTYARLGRVMSHYSRLGHAAPARDPHATGAARPLLAPLRKGAWVTSGTVLGSAPGGAPGTRVDFLFEIGPAGAGPIDPRPVLQAWQLLGETEGRPEAGTQPLFGPHAGEAPASEIQLMSARQLQARLLSDQGLRLNPCGRADIAYGRIERPVLEALDLLLASGIDPTVSALRCGHSGEASAASLAAHAHGDAVTISALNGLAVRDHDGPGSLVELAALRLLTAPLAMRPVQIVGQLRMRAVAGTIVASGKPDRLDVGFQAEPPAPHAGTAQRQTAQRRARAAGGSVTATDATPFVPELDTAQWRVLIKRISQLSEPHVASTPTSAAVPDSPGSPPPAAGALSASPPPPPAGSPARGRPAQGGVPGLDLRVSPTTPLTSQREVLLE